jgi:hypothetical protein
MSFYQNIVSIANVTHFLKLYKNIVGLFLEHPKTHTFISSLATGAAAAWAELVVSSPSPLAADVSILELLSMN